MEIINKYFHELDSISVLKEPVASFWECVHEGWPEKCYSEKLVAGLIELFKQCQTQFGNPIHKILDLGAGAGNPSIGLAKAGYEIVAVDKDPDMATYFNTNANIESVKIPFVFRDWTALLIPNHGNEITPSSFDIVICRGNSFIYAGTWETLDFIKPAVRATLALCMKNIYAALRPGGFFYIDISRRIEYSGIPVHCENIGFRQLHDEVIHIYWFVRYEPEKCKRIVDAFRVFHDRYTHKLKKISSHTFVSYHLPHNELISLCIEAGFECINEYVRVAGEDHYDIFLFRKPNSPNKE